MNLTIGKWIPVVWDDDRDEKASLLEIFQQGEHIRDLAVRPHERIALMRLLICIAQTSLDGPQDYEEWKICRDRLPQAAVDYLDRWRHAFELFGDGQRFLQVRNVESSKEKDDGEANSPSKLDFALASGNNTTLFDNAGGSDRAFSAEALALLLITFQNFSPGGLITNVKWGGVPMGKTSNHAPCIVKAMLHTYIRRGSLIDTIFANLLSRETIQMVGQVWGKPVWEQMPKDSADAPAIENATRTYLGRMAPISRAICLDRNGYGMIMGTALAYDPEWREAAGTKLIREQKGKPERVVLSVSLAKAIWREAHSIAVLATADNQFIGGPLVLGAMDNHAGVDLWCGALAANKSKLLDTVESVLHIPTPMFTDAGQRLYGQSVQYAENWGSRINRAVSAYHRELNDELDRAEFRKRGNLVKQKATSHYWTTVEQRVPFLLALVENPEPLVGKPDCGATEWGKALAHAARAAYELACPHETPRQLKAYSSGLNALFKPIEIETEETVTEEEDEE